MVVYKLKASRIYYCNRIMLNLLDLPEEILIIITRLLDTKSVYSLYTTCRHMKHIIALRGVIKVCNLSLNTLATAKSLQLDMVKHVSYYLHELNMCGVPDLTKNLLLPAIKKMKCLETLNVAYTKITLLDVTDIYKNCPTIKNIAINFQFKSPEDTLNTEDETLEECQEVFKNFINVHFIVRFWYSNLPLYVLKKSSINTLKYTVCDWKGAVCQYNQIALFHDQKEVIGSMIPFNHFCIFLLSWELRNIYQGTWNLLLPLIKLENVEFLIIEYNTSYSVCISPIFTNFFSENFHITSFLALELDRPFYGNVAILIWNKATTIFDDIFFCNLKKKLKEILACEMKVTNEETLTVGVATHAYEQFHFNLVQPDHKERRVDFNGPDCKKRRVVQSSQILTYDPILRGCKDIKLSIYFSDLYIVTLSANSEYLSKLTYLSLKGANVRYSNEFFNVLFRCCSKLVTLNVEAPAISPCCSPIMRSIPLSQSIRNIRLADRRIDFNMLFSAFSQCSRLENICIIDISHEFNNLADPMTMFQKCSNLYCLYIQAGMSDSSAVTKLRLLNKAKIKCSKHHLNLILHNSHEGVKGGYDPYMDVFNLKPIKPI